MRQATIERATSETRVNLTLDLDGTGRASVETGLPFLDHMLELFAHHGRFDIELECQGDTHVDGHHSAEDTAIVLGRAFSEALGQRVGIMRYGDITLPMDEALVLAAVDISGRAQLSCQLDIPTERVGDFDTELVQEFMAAFTRELGASIHLYRMVGSNSHHIIEAAFKALARALRQAVAVDPDAPDAIPSTKGTIR